MLKLTTHQGQPGATARVQVAASTAVTPVHNGNASAQSKGDALTLTRVSQERNPYQGTAPGYATVKVGRWGTGENDSVIGILRSQGYSSKDIYNKGDDGLSLLDRVQQVNRLKNPNLIREGQELTVPVKEKAEQPEQTTPVQTAPVQTTPVQEAPRVETKPAPQTEQTTQTGRNEQADPAVNQVKVGKWGRDKNGSLFEILRNQGFERGQILNQDANGDSLLKKVARANGLESPDKIREGATLNVPNSMEALGRMEIPEMPGTPERKPAERLEVPEIKPIEPKPIELPPLKPIEVPQVKPTVPAAGETKPAESKPNTPPAANTNEAEGTANMGLLLDGVKNGNFTREEFQYLNALSNRYEETRSQFSKEGFSDEELKSLGRFETRYGVTYTRLYNSDGIKLSNNTQSSDDPRAQVRLRHYEEGGALWDGFKSGTIDSDKAISEMIRQRAEARAQGGQ